MNTATSFLHQNIMDQMIELEDEVLDIELEPSDNQLKQIGELKDKLEVAWCGGTKRRGCGNTFNLYTVKYVDGFAVCPHCGRLN